MESPLSLNKSPFQSRNNVQSWTNGALQVNRNRNSSSSSGKKKRPTQSDRVVSAEINLRQSIVKKAAKGAICINCGKKGSFAKSCNSIKSKIGNVVSDKAMDCNLIESDSKSEYSLLRVEEKREVEAVKHLEYKKSAIGPTKCLRVTLRTTWLKLSNTLDTGIPTLCINKVTADLSLKKEKTRNYRTPSEL